MEIKNYGITLRQISAEDLEMLRSWRNSDFVRRYMVFKDYITPEMQKNWFKKINNKNNYYFLIIHEEEPVGLTNIKDIDFKSGTGESGIFLHSPVYTGSIVAIQAIFTTLDFAFIDLNLISLYQTILISNKAAIKLNKYLGVQIVESKDGVIRSILKKENYLIKTHKNRIFLKKHYEN